MKIFMVVKKTTVEEVVTEEIIFSHINQLKAKQECRRRNEKEAYEGVLFLVRELWVETY